MSKFQRTWHAPFFFFPYHCTTVIHRIFNVNVVHCIMYVEYLTTIRVHWTHCIYDIPMSFYQFYLTMFIFFKDDIVPMRFVLLNEFSCFQTGQPPSK